MSEKKYGLIISDKGSSTLKFQASRNVFGNDSDSDDESSKKPVLFKPNVPIKRQVKISQEKAINEDPTVYQYDEVYDQMVDEKQKEKNKTKVDKKPRYIENLMKSASKRKIENERRIERQIQKEREKEGDEFKDKEVFVTSAYKKKLEEMRIEEENEKREEYLENIGDVTKQRDLGGFYRHLYEQKLGKDKTTSNDESKEPIKNKQELVKTDDKGKGKTKQDEKLKKRNYRKRKSSEGKNNLSEGEIEESDEEINRVNLNDIRQAKKSKPSEENIDADSDFSINDPSDEGDDDDEEKVKLKPSADKENISNETVSQKQTKQEENKSDITKLETLKPNNKIVEDKPKIDIWKKRTVGEIFNQALKRYYERKAARGY